MIALDGVEDPGWWYGNWFAFVFDTYVLLNDGGTGRQHETVRRFGRRVGTFAGRAILIACLGLLGLALGTVATQAYRAAQTDPATVLRKESNNADFELRILNCGLQIAEWSNA